MSQFFNMLQQTSYQILWHLFFPNWCNSIYFMTICVRPTPKLNSCANQRKCQNLVKSEYFCQYSMDFDYFCNKIKVSTAAHILSKFYFILTVIVIFQISVPAILLHLRQIFIQKGSRNQSLAFLLIIYLFSNNVLVIKKTIKLIL